MLEQLTEPKLVNTGDVQNPVPVSQAIMDGYAPGSELYTYAEYPQISEAELKDLAGSDYQTVFYEITKKLLGGAIPDDVLKETARDAYSPENFDLDEDDGNLRFTTLPSGVHVVGLSDGPTGAFKDMAMQPLARWMSYLQNQKGSPLAIILSTSGDTGPAALNAFAGLKNTEIIGMLPKKGVSGFQRAQMAQLSEEPGVHVLEVDGDFSYINDLQMKADQEYDLGTVNSVNIARIIAQVPYYVASYIKTIELEGKEVGDPVDVSVPSGNFGNALSAIIARKMGLPLRDIIVATNENNTLDNLIRKGVFELAAYQHTDSSAQDVRMPSNAWRYFSMLFGNDPEKIKRVYKTREEMGSVALGDIGIVDRSVIENVRSKTITTKDRERVIKHVFESTNGQVMIDPHTANGVAAIDKLAANYPNVPTLAMETAKPFKFNEAMMRILGIVPPRPERFAEIEDRYKNTELFQIADSSDLLTYLAEYTIAKAKRP